MTFDMAVLPSEAHKIAGLQKLGFKKLLLESHMNHRFSLTPYDHIWWVVSTPLKNMKVNGKDYAVYYGK